MGGSGILGDAAQEIGTSYWGGSGPSQGETLFKLVLFEGPLAFPEELIHFPKRLREWEAAKTPLLVFLVC